MVEPQATAAPSAAVAAPANRWIKCLQCGAFIYYKRFEKNLRVCPECAYHFRLSARERIALLLDAGSFQERDQTLAPGDPLGFVDSKPYPERIAESRQKTGMHEAAIWGIGEIGGNPVVVCALDFTFIGGSMGSVVGEKVTRAIELGIATKTPVLICSASGGARMQEGIISLMQMAKTVAALAQLAEAGVPYFSLLADPTYGGVSASFAMLGDLIIAEPRVRAGFAGPQVIEQTIRQQLPEGFQTSEFLLDKGQIDLVVPRAELRDTFSRLLTYHQPPARRERKEAAALPAAARESGAAPALSAWEIVQLARHPDRPNLLELAALLFDDFTELSGDRTLRDDPAIVGGLALLGGRPVMVVGHQKGRGTRGNVARNFGMPHPEGYRKALRLIGYAGRLGLPSAHLHRLTRRLPGLAGGGAQPERGHRPQPARPVPPAGADREHGPRRGGQRRRPGHRRRRPHAGAGERVLLGDQPGGLRDDPLQGRRRRAPRRRGAAADGARLAGAGRGRRDRAGAGRRRPSRSGADGGDAEGGAHAPPGRPGEPRPGGAGARALRPLPRVWRICGRGVRV